MRLLLKGSALVSSAANANCVGLAPVQAVKKATSAKGGGEAIDSMCDVFSLRWAFGGEMPPSIGPRCPAYNADMLLDRQIRSPFVLAVISVLTGICGSSWGFPRSRQVITSHLGIFPT